MRLAVLAALAFALPLPAAAQGQAVALVRAGEVLVEINAEGRVVSPAAYAVMSIGIYGEGESQETANRLRDEAVARISAAARAAGVAESDIRIGAAAQVGFIAEPPEALLPPGLIAEGRPHRAGEGVAIRLRDLRRLDTLRSALQSVLGAHLGQVTFGVDDDAQARRAARAAALARARLDAEALAESAGMRVARILRISEPSIPGQAAFFEAFGMGNPFEAGGSRDVVTRISLTVDFAFVPL